MSKIRFGARAVAFLVAVVVSAASFADDLLLTDSNFVGGVPAPPGGSIPLTVTSGVAWTNTVSGDLVDTTITFDRSTAGDALFYAFNRFLFNEHADIQVSIPGFGRGINPIETADYHLTHMTLGINTWSETPSLRIDYTLNIYGSPGTVPEPSAQCFAVLGVTVLLAYSSRFRGEQ